MCVSNVYLILDTEQTPAKNSTDGLRNGRDVKTRHYSSNCQFKTTKLWLFLVMICAALLKGFRGRVIYELQHTNYILICYSANRFLSGDDLKHNIRNSLDAVLQNTMTTQFCFLVGLGHSVQINYGGYQRLGSTP